MNKPLSILTILHMPWDRNLGGSRVQLELADEFQKMGHEVEKFDYCDAFPQAASSPLQTLTRPSFSAKAKTFVQANAHRLILSTLIKAIYLFLSKNWGLKVYS